MTAIRFSRRTAAWLVVAVIILLAAGVWLSQGWLSQLAKRKLVAALSDHFDARTRLDTFSIRLLPHVHVSGTGLELRHHGRTDVPPLIVIKRFDASAGLFELLHQHVSTVRVEGLAITIPPGRDDDGEKDGANDGPQSGGKSTAKTPPSQRSVLGGLVIGDIITDGAAVVILPKAADADHEPLRFDIAHLDLHHFQFEEPAEYEATLTNPKPKGDIACRGGFGPWNREDPGRTPVTGHYQFTHVDLSTIGGIGGHLSSEGDYQGRLAAIEVHGATHTPDFHLTSAGHPMPLKTTFDALIDGTNGDTRLRHIDATIGRSPLVVSGAIAQKAGDTERTIEVDVQATEARLEDLLRLAIDEEQPPLAGVLGLKAHLVIPPGEQDVIRRMMLDGSFRISDGRFTSDGIQAKVDTLSRRGQGEPKDRAIRNVLSTFSGRFDLRRGMLHLPNLAFSVNGAQVHLAGTYGLENEALDFKGNLRLKAHISETTTGVKSFFLKLIDPLFAKHGAGTYLPIQVGGTVQHPSFDVQVGKALSPT